MEEKDENLKKIKNKKVLKIVIMVTLICIIIAAIAYIIYFNLQKNKDNKDIQEVQEYFNVQEGEQQKSEKIQKLKELNQTNADIQAWIQISDTQINYPVLQSEDNEFYLNHNYKKEKSTAGSIYVKSGIDINDKNSNIILYGHDMKDGSMFKGLLNYTDKEYYEAHKNIAFTTQDEEREYEIIAAFKSRIFYADEKNVFRYYNYTNFENEDKFNEYIENVNKIKLYDTGVTASYGEQLITMITCEYSQENGRMVVVAKRIK